MNIEEIRERLGITDDVLVINVNSKIDMDELRAIVDAGKINNQAILVVCDEQEIVPIGSKPTGKTLEELSRPEPFMIKNHSIEDLPVKNYERDYPRKHRGFERPYKYHR
ncbi:MAG: hypothetical protein EHM34_04270 [Nitrosopumilales archaeon]|nr:MAG: hypothetical protein EHM34_04270 [Nitrosopumilales archaeon]